MKRRHFITNTTLAAAGITSLLVSSFNNGPATPGIDNGSGGDDMVRDSSPTTDPDAATNSTSPTIPEFALDEITIAELQAGLASGKFTSVQLVTDYFNRMDQLDNNGPGLHAVIERNPDALNIARALDAERKTGKTRGALHGIPILIKDNIDTADQMQTTAGATVMEGNKASRDAFIVKRLRDAGAILLGKTNLSEWANFRSTHSCSGWSSRGGQTKNPYILDHNPCGSSSGSGVAVSANLCAVAVGTETDGSVTCPASVNGIVGLKPTVGLVSRTGIIPISSTQDTAGPMARSVTDAAILLGFMAGQDADDKVTGESRGKASADYTSFLNPAALSGKRLGVEKQPPGGNPLMIALQQSSIEQLKKQGAVIIEVSYLDAIGKLGGAEFEVMQYEFKAGLNKYLATANARVKTLTDVIAFNKANEKTAMPYFKQETLESSDKKSGLDSAEYKAALKKSHEGTKQIIDKAMDDHRLDALVGLTMGPACSIDNIYGDRWGDVFLTQPAAASGYPHISVPAGKVYDLPVGLSFFGRAYSEGLLLGLAFAYEQASKHREKPGFKTAFVS